MDSLSIPLTHDIGQSSTAESVLDWIAGLSRGNSKSEEELYKYSYKKFYSVVLRYIPNHDDALEVFNTAMIKVFRHINTLEDYEKVESWIRKVIVNTALDSLRANKKNKEFFQPMDDAIRKIADHNTAPEVEYDYKYLINLVHQLPERRRMVFMLFAIEGFSHKEIAEALGITEGNSKLLLHEARKMLQQKLKKSK
ncbi:RNA polymerase sigma factor [Schleiferia thermophila]|uniref:RNA polymerase sigma factor n=1 Tax=Schleiferia thermophila TaxID=884107 RepID=UPI001362627D|nr:sigma-70 family RNA polymerase sigma factor [Schleiferia thermophila]